MAAVSKFKLICTNQVLDNLLFGCKPRNMHLNLWRLNDFTNLSADECSDSNSDWAAGNSKHTANHGADVCVILSDLYFLRF